MEKNWDKYFTTYQPRDVDTIVFSDIFKRFLIADPSKSVLEIGCGGGEFLCHLAKNYKFMPFGIDYSTVGIQKTNELFSYNRIAVPTLYQEDFFRWAPEKKFDVVCSFGFAEHFDDFNDVIRRHAELVTPGGTLIITIPHFAHAQFLFHWLIDRENLKQHNTRSMNLSAFKEAFTDLPLTIKHLSYYKTFGFWTEKKRLSTWEKIVHSGIRNFGRVINRTFGYDRPNASLSPHIVCVAKKNENTSNKYLG